MDELKKIERDENGLVKGLEYKYTDENLIDWRALLPVKYLYINNDPRNRTKLEKKYGKTLEEIDITNDKVEDKDLIINLAGLRYLGRIRGIVNSSEVVNVSSENYASVTSNVTYLANIESEMKDIAWAASASATLENTTSFYQRYLVEAASNRAFARNIRSMCNISIVSREELGANTDSPEQVVESAPLKQCKMLQELMNKKNVKFDPHIVKKLKDANQYKEEYTSIEKLPKEVIFDLLERLKKYNP